MFMSSIMFFGLPLSLEGLVDITVDYDGNAAVASGLSV